MRRWNGSTLVDGEIRQVAGGRGSFCDQWGIRASANRRTFALLKPTLRTYEMICLYLQGWADAEEFLAHLKKLEPHAQ